MVSQKHVHILGICGYTTSGLALMAGRAGYFVTGSDEDAYPPTTDLLTDAGITWHNFHDTKNLTEWGRPDFIVQANQVRANNPELLAALEQHIPLISDSEFFYQLTTDRLRIAICGSHGKTTVSALVVWILETAGRHPGFRLGTLTKNFNSAVRLGEGNEFVFEGDEYTTTFSDTRPKFYYFHPKFAIINNIEWDHPDVFETPIIYRNLFKKYLVEPMPKDGLLVVNADDNDAVEVVKKTPCRVVTFGIDSGNYRATKIEYRVNETTFLLVRGEEELGILTLGLIGEHNLRNSLAAICLSLEMGISLTDVKKALKTFKGTSRRFEVIGEKRGIVVIDDYAHHPTKVRETVKAARIKYPNGRIFAVYVPHTYSRTKALFDQYLEAFKGADFLLMADIEPARERHLEALVNSKELVSGISKKQKNVYYLPDQKQIVDFVKKNARAGDVVLCMSVRGFDGLAQNLVKAIE